MAWTYFTAPLEEGESPTAEMITELLAALTERMQAIDASWQIEIADAEEVALRASRLVTRRCYYTGPGGASNTQGTLESVLNLIAPFYLRPAPIEEGTGTSGALAGSEAIAAAAAELGLSGSTAAYFSTPLDNTNYWNLIRYAIPQLRWIALPALDTTGFAAWLKGAGENGYALTKAAYAAVAETSSGSASVLAQLTRSIDLLGAETTSAAARRVELPGSLTVPAEAIWSAGWLPAFRVVWSVNSGHTFAPGCGVEVEVDGATYEATSPAGPGPSAWVVGDSSTATGALDVALRPTGYADGGVMDELDAAVPFTVTPGGQLKEAGWLIASGGVQVAGKPTFALE